LNRVICVKSTEQAEKLSRRVRRRYLPLFSSLELGPRISRSDARERRGLDQSTMYVISVGRLQASVHGHIKGFDYLLAAMESLADCKLLIIGSGPLHSVYRARISEQHLEDRIELLGEVPPEIVKEYLSAGDIFALPSIHEGLSVAMIEALQCGLPIVASDV